MKYTIDFQEFLNHIIDIELEDINQLYETITSRVDHGPFKYSENDQHILIENTSSSITLRLVSESAKKTFLRQLDKDWGGEMENVLSYWGYLKELDKP